LSLIAQSLVMVLHQTYHKFVLALQSNILGSCESVISCLATRNI